MLMGGFVHFLVISSAHGPSGFGGFLGLFRIYVLADCSVPVGASLLFSISDN